MIYETCIKPISPYAFYFLYYIHISPLSTQSSYGNKHTRPGALLSHESHIFSICGPSILDLIPRNGLGGILAIDLTAEDAL